jgi:CRP/FNR family transcriptional regulator, cyclic AMP receptor protein
MGSQIPCEAQHRLQMQLAEWRLPSHLTEEFIGHHTMVTYPKGFIIFLQGSPADVAFWIFSGLIKIYCPQPDGSRILVRVAGPGDLIGHVDFIDPKGRRAQVFEAHALTKCSLALFTREHVAKALQGLDSRTLIELIEHLNTTWSSSVYTSAAFLGLSFRKRLESVFADLGAGFGVKEARGVLLTPELSHADLAEMIGSSRPMVSRLAAEMTDQGMLARQGKRYILRAGSGLDVPHRWMLSSEGTSERQAGARRNDGANRLARRTAA